jgi:hypothetical protein
MDVATILRTSTISAGGPQQDTMMCSKSRDPRINPSTITLISGLPFSFLIVESSLTLFWLLEVEFFSMLAWQRAAPGVVMNTVTFTREDL